MTILFLGPAESPLLAWLRERERNVMQTDEKVTGDFVQQNGIDFIVSYGYRHKVTADVVDAVSRRAINLHISYLPWNRGADPNFWSFVEDTPKGVTIHYIDEGFDTGDIIAQKKIELDADSETLASSYSKLQNEIQSLFKSMWADFKAGTSGRTVQPVGGSLHKLKDKRPLEYLLTNGWNTPTSVLSTYGAERNAGPPKSVIVLAHEMEPDGTLLAESRARADKAAELSKLYQCPIICVGWNYRKDSDWHVSDAVASYLMRDHAIEQAQIRVDRTSRDTVGDAIFSKLNFPFLRKGRFTVVTSDYHVARTQEIFEFVYGSDAKFEVVGAKVSADEFTRNHERESLAAFYRTFSGVSPGDDLAIMNALIQRHPFYNGKIHPLLSFALEGAGDRS